MRVLCVCCACAMHVLCMCCACAVLAARKVYVMCVRIMMCTCNVMLIHTHANAQIVSKVLERLQALPEPAEDKQVERKEVHEEAVGEAEGNSEDNGGDQDDDDHEMGVEGGTDANDDQDDTNA